MIEIYQGKIPFKELNTMCKKLSEFQLVINTDLVKKDILKLQERLKVAKGSTKDSLTRNLKSLHNIINITDENREVELSWVIDTKTGLPKTYPFNFINHKEHLINYCNYIEINENENLVELDLHELSDIIAFEFMYRDLGESNKSIEELLDNTGVIGTSSSKHLTDFFKSNEDNMYLLSRTLMIEDSPYIDKENRVIQDYFNTKEFKVDSYKEVVRYSCVYAASIIASNMIKKLVLNSINFKFVSIGDNSITLIIEKQNKLDIKNDLIDDIVIRSFGRKFLIKPEVSIF